MSTRPHDPDFVRFARRAGVIAGAAVSVLVLSRILLAAATADVRATLRQESQARAVGDSLESLQRTRTDQRLDRMAAIMELVVVAVAERADVRQREAAVTQLQRSRRAVP